MLLVQNPKLSKLLQNIYLNSFFARMPSGKILKQDSVYVVCFMKKNGKITLLHKKHLQPKSTSGLGSLPVCKKHLYSTSSCSRQALELSTDRSDALPLAVPPPPTTCTCSSPCLGSDSHCHASTPHMDTFLFLLRF